MKPYYQDDAVTIYHGDCREILPHLPKVDLVLTDPPYGIGESSRKNNSRGKLANPTDYGFYDWDSKPATEKQLEMTLGSGNQAIVWGGNYFHLPPSSGWLVWDKLNTGDFADCELAWTNLPMAVRIFRHMWNGMLRQTERSIPRVHPTQKPVALMKWCLGFTPTAQTILDPFMGSGTTLRAAKDLGRQCIGIEIEEKYCEIAAKRMQQEVLPFEAPDSRRAEETASLFTTE